MKALSGLDASFLYLETPRMPMHIGSMAMIEGTINFEDFKAYIEQRLHQVERLQQKVVSPIQPLPATFEAGRTLWI